MADVAPVDPPPAPPPSVRPGSAHTRVFTLAFCTLAAAWGVRNVWWWEPSPLDWLCKLAGCAALAWWAFADARRRRHRIPLLARPWFVLLAGLVVPGYVIWSRGWRGLGWVAAYTALWYVLTYAAMYGVGLAVYGPGWLDAAAA